VRALACARRAGWVSKGLLFGSREHAPEELALGRGFPAWDGLQPGRRATDGSDAALVRRAPRPSARVAGRRGAKAGGARRAKAEKVGGRGCNGRKRGDPPISISIQAGWANVNTESPGIIIIIIRESSSTGLQAARARAAGGRSTPAPRPRARSAIIYIAATSGAKPPQRANEVWFRPAPDSPPRGASIEPIK
jgi:hypothetical protein